MSETRSSRSSRARTQSRTRDRARALRVVRPYMLTRGRTARRSACSSCTRRCSRSITPDQLGRNATPEDRKIIELCQTPTSVAELSARLRTPVGVVRVLVGDLVDAQMVQVRQTADETAPSTATCACSNGLLEGIRAL